MHFINDIYNNSINKIIVLDNNTISNNITASYEGASKSKLCAPTKRTRLLKETSIR